MNASEREVYIYNTAEVHLTRLLVVRPTPHQPAGRIPPMSFIFLSGIF